MSMSSTVIAGQSAVASALWRNRLLLGLVMLHLTGALIVAAALGKPFESGTIPTLVTMLKVLVPVFLLVLFFWRFTWMAMRIRPARPIAFFIADLRVIICDADRVAGGTIAFLSIALFAGTFAFLKDMIPHLVPFSWDPYFAELDRALHGGQDPWRLLMPVFGTPAMTTVLNAIYHFWFFLLYFMVFIACFDVKNPQRNATFLVAFVLTWVIGGNVLATVFSSVGPVYYQAMGFGDGFAEQMDGLRAFAETSPVWALNVQDMLIDGYLNGGPIKGISAMPSMHVASTVVMAIYGFTHSQLFGWALTAFATAILIGSVHLAWHYAVDGYAAIPLALACWCVAQALVRRFS